VREALFKAIVTDLETLREAYSLAGLLNDGGQGCGGEAADRFRRDTLLLESQDTRPRGAAMRIPDVTLPLPVQIIVIFQIMGNRPVGTMLRHRVPTDSLVARQL
jgi:hypothetical protein